MFLLFRLRAVGNSTQNSKDIATFTKILDSLLDGYDNRLRPGLGGKMQATEASIKSKQHRRKLEKFQVNMTPLWRKCTIHLFLHSVLLFHKWWQRYNNCILKKMSHYMPNNYLFFHDHITSDATISVEMDFVSLLSNWD